MFRSKPTGLIIPQCEGQKVSCFQPKCVLRTSYIRTLQKCVCVSNAFKLIFGHSDQMKMETFWKIVNFID